jgi:hypothetical protein
MLNLWFMTIFSHGIIVFYLHKNLFTLYTFRNIFLNQYEKVEFKSDIDTKIIINNRRCTFFIPIHTHSYKHIYNTHT